MLRDGVGLSQDKSMALKFLRQAAESNYGDAELLAQFLEQEGVKLPVKHQASAKKSSASTKKSGVSKKAPGSPTPRAVRVPPRNRAADNTI